MANTIRQAIEERAKQVLPTGKILCYFCDEEINEVDAFTLFLDDGYKADKIKVCASCFRNEHEEIEGY